MTFCTGAFAGFMDIKLGTTDLELVAFHDIKTHA